MIDDYFSPILKKRLHCIPFYMSIIRIIYKQEIHILKVRGNLISNLPKHSVRIHCFRVYVEIVRLLRQTCCKKVYFRIIPIIKIQICLFVRVRLHSFRDNVRNSERCSLYFLTLVRLIHTAI